MLAKLSLFGENRFIPHLYVTYKVTNQFFRRCKHMSTVTSRVQNGISDFLVLNDTFYLTMASHSVFSIALEKLIDDTSKVFQYNVYSRRVTVCLLRESSNASCWLKQYTGN